MRDQQQQSPGPGDDRSASGRRVGSRLRELDRAAVGAARAVRRLAPGGDQLDEDREQRGSRASDRIARLIEEVGADSPSASRELGLAAVATWQALARRRDIGRNGAAVTILFTDLVDFSSWALLAGDDTVLRLLRKVGRVCENAASRHRGTVVKSLGDGLMVAFAEPSAAIDAGWEMCTAVSAIDIDGYRPQLRAGLHTGYPRRVGKDYIGVDVNIAARVSAAAAGGQLLASDAAVAEIDHDRYRLRRKRGFRAKGAPTDIEVYSVTPLG